MKHRKLSGILEVRKSLDGHVWMIGHKTNSAVIETFGTEEEAKERLAVLDAAPELLEVAKIWKRFCDVGENPTHEEIRFMDMTIKKATKS